MKKKIPCPSAPRRPGPVSRVVPDKRKRRCLELQRDYQMRLATTQFTTDKAARRAAEAQKRRSKHENIDWRRLAELGRRVREELVKSTAAPEKAHEGGACERRDRAADRPPTSID